jgi:cytochrome c-type biogenesis protein
MIFVIVPLGKAAKEVIHWMVQVSVYVLASTAGGALVGLALAALGSAVYTVVPGPTAAWPVVLAGLLALLYGLHEAQILRLPQPERAWQVPNAWIRRWPIRGTALFGLILGTGLFTFIPFTNYYVVLAWEAGTGSLLLGAALGAAYGLFRGLPVLVGGTLLLLNKHPLDFNMWLIGHITAWHRASATLLLAVAGFLLGVLLKGV